jgi:hypothetical protein
MLTIVSRFRTAFLAFSIFFGADYARPALAVTISAAQLVGTISASALNETSGIVGSRSLPGTLWVHNDSGHSATFSAISSTGALQGQFSLSGATNTDWEDIAIGPKSGGGNYLYLGDIGDNDANRSQISVFRTVEPSVSTGGSISAANYKQALLQYPGGARNSESLLVDPLSGDLFIITKSPSGQIYRAPSSVFDTAGITQLTSLGNLGSSLNQPSAADISPDGLHILVRDRSTTAYLFERAANQTVGQALLGAGIPFALAAETQGEAIGWAADGKGFYTTSEWGSQGPRPLYYYAFSVPEPATWKLALGGALAIAVGMSRRGSARGRGEGRHCHATA